MAYPNLSSEANLSSEDKYEKMKFAESFFFVVKMTLYLISLVLLIYALRTAYRVSGDTAD